MDDLEDMMMMEAIRLSLAAEDDRKKKAEKEAQKEAKKKAKEEKKREKKGRKAVYGSGASSASGSTLSLSLSGIGRRRGNSGGSNLAREVTASSSNTDTSDSKGKSVDRGVPSTPSGTTPIDFARFGSSTGHSSGSGICGVRHLDTTILTTIHDSYQPSPSPTAPDKPSHLRQMSNASSPASSFIESVPGSLINDFHVHGSSSSLDSPNASGTIIAGHATPDGGDTSGNAGVEPMFNFRSLASMISDKEEKDSARHVEHCDDGGRGESSRHGSREESSVSEMMEESVATLKIDDATMNDAGRRQTTLLEPQMTTPEVMITPVTPAAMTNEDGKQLGTGWGEEHTREITQ
jgi:hypothetical protein